MTTCEVHSDLERLREMARTARVGEKKGKPLRGLAEDVVEQHAEDLRQGRKPGSSLEVVAEAQEGIEKVP